MGAGWGMGKMGSDGKENGGSKGWARGSLGGSTRVALGVGELALLAISSNTLNHSQKTPSDFFMLSFCLGETCFSKTVAGAAGGSPGGSGRAWWARARLGAGFSDRTLPGRCPCCKSSLSLVSNICLTIKKHIRTGLIPFCNSLDTCSPSECQTLWSRLPHLAAETKKMYYNSKWTIDSCIR